MGYFESSEDALDGRSQQLRTELEARAAKLQATNQRMGMATALTEAYRSMVEPPDARGPSWATAVGMALASAGIGALIPLGEAPYGWTILLIGATMMVMDWMFRRR